MQCLYIRIYVCKNWFVRLKGNSIAYLWRAINFKAGAFYVQVFFLMSDKLTSFITFIKYVKFYLTNRITSVLYIYIYIYIYWSCISVCNFVIITCPKRMQWPNMFYQAIHSNKKVSVWECNRSEFSFSLSRGKSSSMTS